MFGYKWSWSNPDKPKWKEVRFSDGMATVITVDGEPAASASRITGPNKVTLEEFANKKLKTVLTFDQTFSSFVGAKSWDSKERITGTRMERITQSSTATTAASLSTAGPTTIQTDPNQPRIEVLKDQAPNAIEWTLAPLEQAVPGDIRQNLTFLREDLLDEGKQQPKASAAAYTLAAQLCQTVLAALEERNQTLARAGFRAVEAQARTGVTSQALEARRNNKMSWPQFAREESQRAELKSQAIAGANVMAERPKLEWSQRTATLRKTLDTLYAQFREALRQGAPTK